MYTPYNTKDHKDKTFSIKEEPFITNANTATDIPIIPIHLFSPNNSCRIEPAEADTTANTITIKQM